MLERVISMDITNFMTWFIEQVVDIFTFVFVTLDSITFMGTSLLRVLLTIMILSVLVTVLLTIARNPSYSASRSGKVKSKESDKNEKD